MSGAGLLARLFGGPVSRPRRDGEAAALEAHATGIPPALLEAGAPARPRGASPDADPGAGRRQRPLALPHEILMEGLSQKVLNGWMQNRHQTLYPLTVNLRTLDGGRSGLLARLMAAVLLAGVRAPDEGRVASSLAWLGQVGGGDEAARALRAGLDAPEPLSPMLGEVHDAGLAAYAYVVSLVATDPRDDAGQLFLDYLAVRLALPADVVHSANRRHRRRQASASSVRAASAP